MGLVDVLGNAFYLKTHVLAKFFNGDKLVSFFVEMILHLSDEASAVPFAAACDYLNVFRIDTQSIHCQIFNLNVKVINFSHRQKCVSWHNYAKSEKSEAHILQA